MSGDLAFRKRNLEEAFIASLQHEQKVLDARNKLAKTGVPEPASYERTITQERKYRKDAFKALLKLPIQPKD